MEVFMKSITALIIGTLCLVTAGYPQDIPLNTQGWNILKSIPLGQQLQVNTKESKSISGKMEKITDTSLVLTTKEGIFSFQSIDVAKVYILRGRPIAKRTLIGTAAGTGVGGAIGYITGKDDAMFGRGFSAAAGGGLGLVIGSVTGLVLGLSKNKSLVYETIPAQ
jgi:hypothetical protein